MRARLLNLELKLPSPGLPDDIGASLLAYHALRSRGQEPHYLLTVVVDNPVFLSLPEDLKQSYNHARTRTEDLISRAVQRMLHNPEIYDDPRTMRIYREHLDPPVKETGRTMAHLVSCNHCKAEIKPHEPKPGWREEKSLYQPIYPVRADEPKHFCSDQCQVNHILQHSTQPIVLEPRNK